jgi:NAD-dependent dihydropyrimidine dehydrogenase PreA subunit
MASNGSGMFIRVEVDDPVASDRDAAQRLAQVCPVDIFAAVDGHVDVVEPNLDECILCYQCVEAAPDGTVRVIKLYES